jgi:glutathione S-transferase
LRVGFDRLSHSGFLLGLKDARHRRHREGQPLVDMTDCFRSIEAILRETAPMTAALMRRIADMPLLAKLTSQAQQDYGDACCGGQIETSLRKLTWERPLSDQVTRPSRKNELPLPCASSH